MSLSSSVEGMLLQAKEIDSYLGAISLSGSSADDDTLNQLPEKLQKTRQSLIDAIDAFRSLVRGPTMTTMDIVFAWTDALPLRIIYHFKLAHAVPLEGSATYAQIAHTTGLCESWCFRSVRAVIGKDIFTEDAITGEVRHTAISRMLATNQGFADVVGLQLCELGPASSKLIDVWERHGQLTGDPSQSAFSMYNATDKSLFAVLAADPERARRFGNAMHFTTDSHGWDLRHLGAAIDWSVLDKPGSIIVDVGGGHGQVSQYLARQTQHMRFVVQDLEHVASAGSAALPSDLSSRIEFVGHDFFALQDMHSEPPATFLLHRILHDWSDESCIKILKGLVPALKEGSRLLICEYMLEDQPVKSSSGRFGLQSDMTMATVLNGQERYRRDFERLLEQSHGNFVLEGVHRPIGSMMSLIDVEWKSS